MDPVNRTGGPRDTTAKGTLDRLRSSRMSTSRDVVAAPIIGSTEHGHASKALWTYDLRGVSGAQMIFSWCPLAHTPVVASRSSGARNRMAIAQSLAVMSVADSHLRTGSMPVGRHSEYRDEAHQRSICVGAPGLNQPTAHARCPALLSSHGATRAVRGK